MKRQIGLVLAGALGVFVMLVVISFVFSYPVMLLWNGCLVPAVVGLKEIGWLQAWGIMFLCGLLFKSPQKND